MNFENDAQKVQRALLDDVLMKGIEKNEEQCKIWTAYKKGHEKVAEALQILQKDLYVNCMVPIGKRALMKGKLIHTNEVLACLGDGYFAKYSAFNAIALCQRRIQKAEEMLKNLSMERDLYETRMMVSESDLFEDFSGSEIVEHWNENQIIEWKKKHREKEKEYHEKLAEVRQEERKKLETEEDLFNRLDQLEIEEELADELNRLGIELEEEDEEEFSYHSENSSENQEEDFEEKNNEVSNSDNKQLEKSIETCKIKKSVSFAEAEKIFKKEEENLIEKHSKDIESSDEDIVRIKFTHSENKPVVNSSEDSIQAPADIYRLFSKPKSILKRSPNDVNFEQLNPPEYSIEEEEEEEEEEQCSKPSIFESVVKDIKEKDTTIVADVILKNEEENKNRPISKFKRDRQFRK